MNADPCNVCGSTELNLIDGYYYCVECGTQDVNTQETIVEQKVLADGTFAHTTSRKIKKILTDGIKMNEEWYKWHAFNFILSGLTEELLALGAKESFKQKVLWIWIRYIKKYQVKENTDNTLISEIDNTHNSELRDQNSLIDSEVSDSMDDEKENKNRKSSKKIIGKKKDINVITKWTLVAILYAALNLDRSNIQISHLFRFINEGRLSVYTCKKFVPKELDTKCISHWYNFLACTSSCRPMNIRVLTMELFKQLNLGLPIVPNLTKIFDDLLTELCLPLDFKKFVLSLTRLISCEFLQLDAKSIKSLIKIPDYEGVCMTYILLGLKLCFGLDCDYEIKLSNLVDEINEQENRLKSYKLGFHSEPTDRLFSFRDWYKFIKFRKIILCQNYSPMASQFKVAVDETVLMEHMDERRKKKQLLGDEVTMDIINKILHNNNFKVIPKKEFPATTTPFTTYTEIILQNSRDPDFNLLLCEDFSQYSLKYVTEYIGFSEYNHKKDMIQGISKINKTINPDTYGNLVSYKNGDMSLVFVRNCENNNWLETKPPHSKHITKVKDEENNDEDPGYNSNSESSSSRSTEGKDKTLHENTGKLDNEHIVQVIEEEYENVTIFDDDFALDPINENSNINNEKDKNDVVFEFNNLPNNENEAEFIFNDQSNMSNEFSDSYIDPDKIDRNKIIQELLDVACRKYKIPKPKENSEPRKRLNKRKLSVVIAEADDVKRKKCENKTKPGVVKNAINNIISSYYENMKGDILNQLSEHVRSIIQTVENQAYNNLAKSPDPIHGSNLDNNELNFQDDPEIDNNELTNADATTVNSIGSPNMEDSVIDDETILPTSPNYNPDFDKKTYDIKQLYIELKDSFDKDDNIDTDDKDLLSIVDSKIQGNSKSNLENEIDNSEESSYDSDDDLPLSVLQEDKRSIRKQNSNQSLERLIKNPPKIFNMWLRHYKSRLFVSSKDMTDKFDLELSDNCPESFVFVIHECASILDCSAYSLYKCLQTLEGKLLSHKS